MFPSRLLAIFSVQLRTLQRVTTEDLENRLTSGFGAARKIKKLASM